jgi:uncharacterized SAM-binding protein YcdF (DUF218 family)
VFRILATTLFLPPVNLVLLALAGLLLLRRRFRAGLVVVTVCLCALLVLSLPITSGALLDSLEDGRAGDPGKPAGAIVILGADVNRGATEDATTGPGPLTLERLRAGAALYRTAQLPILVTGGTLRQGWTPVARVMAQSLREDFGVPVRWTEDRSRDTWENARFSAAILKTAGIGSVYVVTHPWHMRRALIAFSQFGIAATPAPTQPHAPLEVTPGDFIPETRSWMDSYFALHEWVGCAYYELRAIAS